MFDKLEDLLKRYEEMQLALSDPAVTNDTNRFRKLMKEQSDMQPLVEAYEAYKKAKETIADSEELLQSESDEDMREMLKEELSAAKEDAERLEQEMKILLLPKDPLDEKDVVVEIRAGAGGDEAALFAAELYRMYIHNNLSLSVILCSILFLIVRYFLSSKYSFNIPDPSKEYIFFILSCLNLD